MTMLNKARKMLRSGRQVILPGPQRVDPADQAAWEDAVALWNDLFAPFAPVVEGADVLELGCGDGRLAGALAASGRARSVTGLDHHPYWTGVGGGTAWGHQDMATMDLAAGLETLNALEDGTADLILARQLDSFLPLSGLEDRLERLYALLRPGGEMLARLRCGDGGDSQDAPGYGFLTPTAWVALMLGAGFEIAGHRRVWRTPADQRAAAARLPEASDDERLTAELHLHLIRPWESWELDALRPFGDQHRARNKKAG